MHTTLAITNALDKDIAKHGQPIRFTASSVWDFGVVFADGYKNRYAMPRGTIVDAKDLHRWVRSLARRAGASHKTAF